MTPNDEVGRNDLERIFAKVAMVCTTCAPAWVTIKNRAYSQAVGRHEHFDARRRASRSYYA